MRAKTLRWFTFLTLLIFGLEPVCLWAADAGAEREPRRSEAKAEEVINFSLLDYKGKHYELRRSDARVVVLYFTSFGCPSARQSLPKLRAFRNQFEGKGVALWLINSCTQEDPSDNMIEMLV